MGSIISKLTDEIILHGSYKAYCLFRESNQYEQNKKDFKSEDITYLQLPEVIHYNDCTSPPGELNALPKSKAISNDGQFILK